MRRVFLCPALADKQGALMYNDRKGRGEAMKPKSKRILRLLLFALAGALAGYAYYFFFGCTRGCAITGSPWRSMLYMAVLGLFIAFASEKEGDGQCNT